MPTTDTICQLWKSILLLLRMIQMPGSHRAFGAASVEMNLLVKDAELTTELKSEIETVIQTKCVHINQSSYKAPLLKRLWQALCYYAVTLLVTLGTFYYKREE